MWLRLWRGCTVCALQAAQVQGGLGLPEVQAMRGLCASESLSEGQLHTHQRRCLRGLLARVSWAISLLFNEMFPKVISPVPSKLENTGIRT